MEPLISAVNLVGLARYKRVSRHRKQCPASILMDYSYVSEVTIKDQMVLR